jgi:hypothetical protein
VNRGGSWNNDAGNCRAANRNRNTPDNRNNNLGFRLARAPQVGRMLCPTEPTAFPVPLPSLRSGQIVALTPFSAGSKREGSGRSFLAQKLRLAKDWQSLEVQGYGLAAKAQSSVTRLVHYRGMVMGERRKYDELTVITKTYELILWSCNHTGKFPRNHRFVLGERIERNL